MYIQREKVSKLCFRERKEELTCLFSGEGD